MASDGNVALEEDQNRVKIIEESSHGSISNRNSQINTSEFKITNTSEKKKQAVKEATFRRHSSLLPDKKMSSLEELPGKNKVLVVENLKLVNQAISSYNKTEEKFNLNSDSSRATKRSHKDLTKLIEDAEAEQMQSDSM